MLFQIIPQLPNPREKYHIQVEPLCHLLADRKGQEYRWAVFGVLTLTGANYQREAKKFGLRKFRDSIEANRFIKEFPADVTALQIINELNIIYGNSDAHEINHLRGAVIEIFSYLICQKLFSVANKEVKVQIGEWTSKLSIDSAGCSGTRGCCFQGKASSDWWSSIKEQKEELNEIENRTSGKAIGAFLTFESAEGFQQNLIHKGLKPEEYKVFGRYQMEHFENTCSAS